MSFPRIVILVLGMAVILVLGTWGWTAAINAVNEMAKPDPVIIALTVYGIAFGFLIAGIGFPYLVMRIGNDDW